MTKNERADTLDEAWALMTFSIEGGCFALVGTSLPATPEVLAELVEPWQLVREGGETTVLVPEMAVERVLAALSDPEAKIERALLWVRFEAAMGWEVVGFLARVTGALAEAGVPLGAICGYSRDHLFIAARFEAETRTVLEGLFGRR